MNNNEKMNSGFLWIFVVLIAVFSYMTTAFFIHAWPFAEKSAIIVENENPVVPDFLEEIEPGSYEISNGKRLIFDGVSMIYPKGWVLMNIDESSSIVGVDGENPDVSVGITMIGVGSSDKTTSVKLKNLLATRIDNWYEIASMEEVNFLSRECTLFSGDIVRGGNADAMMVLAISDGERIYLLTGVFPKKIGNQEIIEEIFASFQLVN